MLNCNKDQVYALIQLLRKSIKTDKLIGQTFDYDLNRLISVLLEAGYYVDFHFTESIQEKYSMGTPMIRLSETSHGGFELKHEESDKVSVLLRVSINRRQVEIDTTMDEVTDIFVSIPDREHSLRVRFVDIFSFARLLHFEKFLWSEEKQGVTDTIPKTKSAKVVQLSSFRKS